MARGWLHRKANSLHRRRTKRTIPWTLARILKVLVFPVGEECELSFWAFCLQSTLPGTCVVSSILLLALWTLLGGRWVLPATHINNLQTEWHPAWIYTWINLCGASATECACFVWLPPLVSIYLFILGCMLQIIWTKNK